MNLDAGRANSTNLDHRKKAAGSSVNKNAEDTLLCRANNAAAALRSRASLGMN
jgi:hypothetical protein